ncbi:MAG: translation elongation factor 4 [Patescibacteria group bacterium]|nr:translation elongation factor 4 [Patescibacteria group bacterium]
MNNIRNFCIIAHIDHGKSTLADRFLELTKTVEKRKMMNQLLDTMELERERGITIKLQPVRMDYELDGQKYILNLIDTPGHVDFTYEVSRSLAAVEGAILLVDATQGVQAQTLANYHLATDQGLKIIPVINKIDLPNANVPEAEEEIKEVIIESLADNFEILKVSGKTGENVEKILEQIIKNVPAPIGENEKPLQALIFDSVYDDYRGVVAYVRLLNGEVKRGDQILLMGTNKESEVLEVGYFKPQKIKSEILRAGEIGYIVTGFKELSSCRVGDTVTLAKNKEDQNFSSLALPGYKEIKPMVFAGFFCKEGIEFEDLREGLEKIKLTDASLSFEPEHSPALGPGFRCGFLGLLHLEIIQERLHREHKLDLMVTVPSVAYKLIENGKEKIIRSPQELPNNLQNIAVEEPWVRIDIISPKEYLGGIMQLVAEKRGSYINTTYLSENRLNLHYELPLASLLTDFYDKLKSVSSGYASLNYDLIGYRPCEVERLDIVVADEMIDSLATIVYRDSAYEVGRKIVDALKDTLPKQMFEIKIQATLGYQNIGKQKGGKVIASSRVAPYRKDVIGTLSGGDVSRKNKLLDKQKKGKKKMKALGRGRVDIPAEAYLSVLKR